MPSKSLSNILSLKIFRDLHWKPFFLAWVPFTESTPFVHYFLRACLDGSAKPALYAVLVVNNPHSVAFVKKFVRD